MSIQLFERVEFPGIAIAHLAADKAIMRKSEKYLTHNYLLIYVSVKKINFKIKKCLFCTFWRMIRKLYTLESTKFFPSRRLSESLIGMVNNY